MVNGEMLVSYWRWKMSMFVDVGTLVTVDYWPCLGTIVSSGCMDHIQKETMMWCWRLENQGEYWL